MRTERVDEGLLQKYLLGNVSEEEQVQVEDRAFADAGYLGALEAAEADLIDAYVRGELSSRDRRRFEHRFFLSPQRRSKVEFARAFARVTADSNIRPLAAPRPSAWPAFAATFRAWSPAVQLSAAAAVLVLIGGGLWLATQNAAMRSQLATMEAQQRAAENRAEALSEQLKREEARSAAPTHETPKPLSAVAALVFVPNLSRAARSMPELALPPGAQLAHLQIQLETRDDFPRFRAELHTRSGEDVLTRANLSRRRTGSGFAVALDVPASALPAGDYELALKGVAGDQTTDIGFYYFRVLRQ